MAEGERATGTPNTIYDLASVLFHALEGGASYDTYVEDAEREGDEELTEFFRRVREEDRDRAAEARLLLAERTLTAAPIEEETTAVPPRLGSSTNLPGAEPVAEDAGPEDVRRQNMVAVMPDEDLTPPEEAVPPDVPEPPGVPPRTGVGESPRTEQISTPPGPGDVPSRRTEEASSRTEEVPSGTPPQAPPGDVQRNTSPTGQEGTEQPEGEDEKGLLDKARDALLGEEERGREGAGEEDRR
jgi:hypothetical protein